MAGASQKNMALAKMPLASVCTESRLSFTTTLALTLVPRSHGYSNDSLPNTST